MTIPTLTCDHCESEIDIAKDPRCVVYDPSGITAVICEACREHARRYRLEVEKVKSEKTITTDRVALGPHPDQPNHEDHE